MFNAKKYYLSEKTLLLIIILFFHFSQFTFGQTPQMNYGYPGKILSFISENFETDIFPPQGWILEYTGTLYWQHYPLASGYGIGTGCAQFFFNIAPQGTIQSLVLTSLGPTVAGDSLSFDHAYTTYDTEIDLLIIEISDDAGVTYSTLVTLNGGAYGPLRTAPPTHSVFVPTPSQWATKRYALPPGTNRIRFKAVSGWGNNLYIDNCRIGSQLTTDVGVQSIDIANPTLEISQIPKATVRNHGTTSQSFSVTMHITPGSYTSTQAVTSLPASEDLQLSFDEWTPLVGSYNINVFTTLPGDMDNSNDTLGAITEVVRPQISNMNAIFKNGQVFITWDELQQTDVVYTVYKSPDPIEYGYQLSSAQNLGNVRDNSRINERLSEIIGVPISLKIDSASTPIAAGKGLFVATATETGSFYYAITARFNNLEDTTIIAGSNSLISPVSETVMMPKPVWQQNRTVSGKLFEIYVLYATKVTSSIYPQMTNAGTFPYNFAIVKSGNIAPHPLTIYLHAGGYHFLPTSTFFKTTGDPNEWVLSIDEWIPGMIFTTYSYGFHENYDLFAATNPVPTSGMLYNYTAKKVEFIIDWAIQNLPVDSTRTYMTGWSMGAIGSIFNSIMIRDKIAAIFIFAPVFDLAKFGNDYMFRLWGTYQTNLMTNEGYRMGERLDAKFLLSTNKLNSLPLLFTFCGKHDGQAGWEEKPAFYDSIRVSKHGGYHFWSWSDHGQTYLSSPWSPSFPNFSFLTRYRTDLSYPAFSNCSIDYNPGNGGMYNGDAIGSINGHLDWKDDIVDVPERWEITLFVKDLVTTSGTLTAPDSATTDVTLRRLQNFIVPEGYTVHWQNLKNHLIVQQESFTCDSGPVTLHGVKVYKDSSRIQVTYSPSALEYKTLPVRYFVLKQNYPNPFNPNTTIEFDLPKTSKVSLKIFNIVGEEVATLVSDRLAAGSYSYNWDAANLASGVYLYRLQAGKYVQMRKMVLMR
ncbi:MAG: T9SS type A sorting domain-containing protein [Calditrichaeota bacterium]|nr:T9SS type A sorting domain-containing protein [Calditrichota bacterium]